MRMDEIRNGIKNKRYECNLFCYNRTPLFFIDLALAMRRM